MVGTATVENSTAVSRKTKTTIYDPAIPLLGIYAKKTKTLIQKGKCTLMFTVSLFTIAKIWKQPRCPSMDEWIKKCFTYIYI